MQQETDGELLTAEVFAAVFLAIEPEVLDDDDLARVEELAAGAEYRLLLRFGPLPADFRAAG
jgi:hypothetical protein